MKRPSLKQNPKTLSGLPTFTMKMRALTSHSISDAHHSGSVRASQSPRRVSRSRHMQGLPDTFRPSVRSNVFSFSRDL